MNHKKILTQHEQFCSIWQATDGRFKTKLPDESKPGGKRLIAKTSRADLEKFIIEWYKLKQGRKENTQTMKSLFPEWLKYKMIDSSKANAAKLQWVWNKYYADSDIIDMNIEKIDVITIKSWYLKVIGKHKLSSKRYKEMKSLANMLFDFAVEKRFVTINVSRNVHGISSKKYTEPPRKEITEQVYIDNEEQLILKQAEIQYRKTHYIDKNGKFYTKGYSIVPYPKTEAGKRDVFLSMRAKKYLAMILEHNRQNGFDSEYLFLDKNDQRIHEFSVNNALRNLNSKIGTNQKSNHKIRKTCISKMISSKKLTNEEIRMFAGHEDFATTEKFYEFPTDSMIKRAAAFEAALFSGIHNLFPFLHILHPHFLRNLNSLNFFMYHFYFCTVCPVRHFIR
ncbi:MAG: site-specific integrase [Lachnospiraceae bacterium]|nr:site-specific integrase [Lachnospiraceae bacterium]